MRGGGGGAKFLTGPRSGQKKKGNQKFENVPGYGKI